MISFEHVGKRYRSWNGSEFRALTDFSLEIIEGELFGIAGPNGAGKSTLIALLLGFLGPTEGTIDVAGLAPRAYVERHGVGYLSELVNIPPAWRVRDALERYALLAGHSARDARQRSDVVIDQLGLGEHRQKRVRQLSKGNLQRVGLGQALLGDSRLIVLDEPTHGLDPLWTQRFRDIVNEIRRPDRVILIASHNLDELARLADRVGILDHGALQRIVDIRATSHAVTEGAPYRLVLAHGDSSVAPVFPGARDLGGGTFELRDTSLEALNHGVAALMLRGAVVSAFYPVHSALEQHFREVVGASEEST